MADKTINQLDTIESIANDDKLPIWDTSTSSTGQISRENFLSGYQPTLTFDTAPTPESTNPVTSKGIFTSNAIITASSTTITNAPVISNGSVIRIMFTSTISGSDTSTAMSLSYNGIMYSVKVGKNGSLTNFVATEINNSYYYLQAYTTLELAFDGTQFVIVGNPVVLSSSDYTIYANEQRAFPSNNLGKDLYSIFQSQTAFVYGSKVIKSGINVSSTGTEVDISDVLNLFNITTGYYSFLLRIITRSTTYDMYDEYIVSHNRTGGFVVKINSDPNGTSRTVTPSAPTSSSIKLTGSVDSSYLMLTFEPIGYY